MTISPTVCSGRQYRDVPSQQLQERYELFSGDTDYYSPMGPGMQAPLASGVKQSSMAKREHKDDSCQSLSPESIPAGYKICVLN